MSPDDTDEIDKESLDQNLQELKSMIDNFKALGVDVEAVETILNQAIKSLKDDNLVIANTLFESAKETYKLIKQQYFIQASSILFSSLQRTVLELESAGQDVDSIKDLYNQAKGMFDSGQYEDAMGYIKSAEDMATDLKAKLRADDSTKSSAEEDQSQEQMERVSKILIRVDDLLQKAIDGGYSIHEAEKLYSLAEDAFDYQDYKKAESYAIDAEKTLTNILEPSYDEDSLEDKGESKQDISKDTESTDKTKRFSDIVPKGIIGDAIESKDSEIDEEGVSPEDTPDSSQVVDEAPAKSSISDLKADLKEIMERVPTKRITKKPKRMIKSGDTKHSQELVQDVAEKPKHDLEFDAESKPEIEPLTKKKKSTKPEYAEPELDLTDDPEEDATILMKALEAKIGKANNADLNIPMAERLYSIAESYFEDGEYESVIEYTKKGIKNINDLATRKGLADEVGLEPVGGVDQESDLEPDEGKVVSEQIDEDTKDIEKTEKTEPKKKKKKKKKKMNKAAAEKIKMALKKISSEIKATKGLGIPIEKADRLMKKAVFELKANNLADAKEYGIQARNEIKTIKAGFVKQKALDMIKVSWKEIADAEARGENTTEANRLLQKARNLIKSEKYEKAAATAMKVLDMYK